MQEKNSIIHPEHCDFNDKLVQKKLPEAPYNIPHPVKMKILTHHVGKPQIGRRIIEP